MSTILHAVTDAENGNVRNPYNIRRSAHFEIRKYDRVEYSMAYSNGASLWAQAVTALPGH
jgi:hypothetical protein